MPLYFPTPEETAECSMCGHRANLTAFWIDGIEENGSECPTCGFPKTAHPYVLRLVI